MNNFLKLHFFLFSCFSIACIPPPLKPPPTSDTIIRESVVIPINSNISLAGELTLPGNISLSEKRPAILLIQGSGPLDRNETIPKEFSTNDKLLKPFQQIADTLTRAGFIVLRYDKRGVKRPFDSSRASIENPDYIDLSLWRTVRRETLQNDVERAIGFLQNDPRVYNISLLGHSEGTSLAPLIVKDNPSIAALILLAPTGRNLKEILYFQSVERQLIEIPKLFDTDLDGQIAIHEVPTQFQIGIPFSHIDQNQDEKLSHFEYESYLIKQWQEFLQNVQKGKGSEILQGFPKAWYRSWFEASSNLELLPGLRKLPILILQGEDDQQTPLETEARPLYKALLTAKHFQVELHTYPGLGHGFSPRRNQIPTLGPIDKKVLQDLVFWARKTLFSTP